MIVKPKFSLSVMSNILKIVVIQGTGKKCSNVILIL